MKWEKQRFGDVIEFNPRVSLEKGVEYPYLPMEEILPGRKFNPPSNTRVYKSGGARFANNDTVLARITPCLENGKVSKIAHLEGGLGFGSTEYFVFRAIEGKTDPDYIYYLAASDIVRQPAIKSMVGASGRQRADRGVVENLMIPFPDVETQKYIAGILSAYDDLIDNNNRRISLLEEAIHRLYREWFVHLRFPGHEHTPVVDGVPEGWEKRPLEEVGFLNYGKSLTKSTREEGDIPVYGSSGVIGTHNKALIPGPSIIVGRKGNVGSVFWCDQPSFPIDTVFYISPEQSSVFLFLNLQHQNFINTDAAVPGLNRNYAHKLPILMPTERLLAQFEEIATPIHKQITTLQNYNVKLAEARDALLPRLMNGSLPV